MVNQINTVYDNTQMFMRINSIQRLFPVEEKDLVYRNAFCQAWLLAFLVTIVASSF